MEVLSKAKETYNALWKLIIQPKRVEYDEHDFSLRLHYPLEDQCRIKRTNFSIYSDQNERLNCYRFQNQERPSNKVIIYAHTHTGSALEGLFLVERFISKGFDCLTFDFGGNGQSTRPHVTLGHKEKEDLRLIVSFCLRDLGYSEIYLWGRSMGASTILLMLGKYRELQKNIMGVVLDSPFGNLRKMCSSIGTSMTGLPGILIESGLKIIRKTIIDEGGFDIDLVKPKLEVPNITVPCVFVLAENEEFIQEKTYQKMIRNYGGIQKKVYLLKGANHGSLRSPSDVKLIFAMMHRMAIAQGVKARPQGCSGGAYSDNGPLGMSPPGLKERLGGPEGSHSAATIGSASKGPLGFLNGSGISNVTTQESEGIREILWSFRKEAKENSKMEIPAKNNRIFGKLKPKEFSLNSTKTTMSSTAFEHESSFPNKMAHLTINSINPFQAGSDPKRYSDDLDSFPLQSQFPSRPQSPTGRFPNNPLQTRKTNTIFSRENIPHGPSTPLPLKNYSTPIGSDELLLGEKIKMRGGSLHVSTGVSLNFFKKSQY